MSISRRQFAGLTLSTAALTLTGTFPTVAGDEKRTGTFSGRQGYTAEGGVVVKRKDGKMIVKLNDDFKFVGTPPDIKIGFGNNLKYAKGTKIHEKFPREAYTGTSTYVVPASIDTSKYNEVYIYCERFNVILGVAELN